MITDGHVEEIVVSEEEAGGRLDRVLAVRLSELSRSRLKALIVAGRVSIGGRPVHDPAQHVKSSEVIVVDVPPAEPAEPAAEDIPLEVIHEDEAIIVINKPAGLVVHPAAGHASGTLVNALIAHCGASLSGIGGVKRPGIVHRLDKDTTGVLIAAKTDRAHKSLTDQFADHGRTGVLRRAYVALVWGAPKLPSGTIDLPIDRHRTAREKMAVRTGGREAITHWQVIERFTDKDGTPVASALLCELETGRTHQIRVHLAHAGHPLLGDDVYGSGFKTKAVRLDAKARALLEGLGRQALHAAHLTIAHPLTGEEMSFDADWPEDMAKLAQALRW
ncbi:RluA family pseudouridine synthase [Bradyrhizobium sp. LHD-71]|uniref:RluA family pseudouridine synthase n=1 Tax=Bradyrhizobium sp. LHD-71 TaxID=3072141 RepID=UPI00281047B3|nr:RluA family pseudouridine synthase [Bradyrhizobium sp. LHD-71]MDQ8732466.1 RluA family pseudouridine synthase [Bradyrhizobium sp. LHD-71]